MENNIDFVKTYQHPLRENPNLKIKEESLKDKERIDESLQNKAKALGQTFKSSQTPDKKSMTVK